MTSSDTLSRGPRPTLAQARGRPGRTRKQKLLASLDGDVFQRHRS